MCSDESLLQCNYTFIVRIWWEPGLTRPDGRPLWRGQVQHVASGGSLAFQSLEELLGFIQGQAGDLEGREGAGEGAAGSPQAGR